MKNLLSVSFKIICVAALVAFPGYPVEAALKAGREMLSIKKNEPTPHALSPKLKTERTA